MNHAGLAAFRLRALSTSAAIRPANITIAGQAYDVVCTGFQRQRDLISGGWLNKYEVAFRVALSAFATAGMPVPHARTLVTVNTLAGTTPPFSALVVESTPIDATGTIITLRCQSREQ